MTTADMASVHRPTPLIGKRITVANTAVTKEAIYRSKAENPKQAQPSRADIAGTVTSIRIDIAHESERRVTPGLASKRMEAYGVVDLELPDMSGRPWTTN
ncbi:hypothetical protein ABT173_30990 [Streptomyces sp. NPDC001795]|uniref:hypothetical protein n=1 Tax=unclassified Streptomyces TaxID=2593676 RepID=UPI00332E2AC4